MKIKAKTHVDLSFSLRMARRLKRKVAPAIRNDRAMTMSQQTSLPALQNSQYAADPASADLEKQLFNLINANQDQLMEKLGLLENQIAESAMSVNQIRSDVRNAIHGAFPMSISIGQPIQATPTIQPLPPAIPKPAAPKQDLVTTSYSMSRTLTKATEAWREYSQGLEGNVSLRQLEAALGTAWRSSDRESKYFQRRMRLIRAIQALSLKQGVSETEIAERLESLRIRKRWSLNQLSDQCKANIQEIEKSLTDR